MEQDPVLGFQAISAFCCQPYGVVQSVGNSIRAILQNSK